MEAWRLLGESRLLNADAAKSVAAYEKAIALSPDNQTVITVSVALPLSSKVSCTHLCAEHAAHAAVVCVVMLGITSSAASELSLHVLTISRHLVDQGLSSP